MFSGFSVFRYVETDENQKGCFVPSCSKCTNECIFTACWIPYILAKGETKKSMPYIQLLSKATENDPGIQTCMSFRVISSSPSSSKSDLVTQGRPTEKVAGSIRALPKWGGGSNRLPEWVGALIQRRSAPAEMGIFWFMGGSRWLPGWFGALMPV